MKSQVRKWLLIFLMLWLPMQGAAAAVLSVCAQETHHPVEQAMRDGSDHHHGDCHKQDAGNSASYLLSNLPCNDSSCEAYSHMPILPHHAAAAIVNNRSAIISYFSGFVSFVPDQPQHPPLTA